MSFGMAEIFVATSTFGIAAKVPGMPADKSAVTDAEEEEEEGYLDLDLDFAAKGVALNQHYRTERKVLQILRDPSLGSDWRRR